MSGSLSVLSGSLSVLVFLIDTQTALSISCFSFCFRVREAALAVFPSFWAEPFAECTPRGTRSGVFSMRFMRSPRASNSKA